MTTTARRQFGIPMLPALVPLLLACCGGCGGGPVPDPEFVAQAEALHQTALRSAVSTDRNLNDYFAEIGKRIIQGATNVDAKYTHDATFANMEFHLVGSPIPNAFTTGGRHVYIYNGLFQLCDSEEELAAVMTHEFAHAVRQDVQKTGMKPDPRTTPDKIAYSFVTYPFGAEVQQEADGLGFEFFARGGWDPARFAEVYERLLNRGLDSPGAASAPNSVPLVQRAAAVRQRATRLPSAARNWRQPPVADAQSFGDLKNLANLGGEPASPRNAAWLYLRALPNCLLPFDLPAQQEAQRQLKVLVTPPPAVAPHPEPS